MTVKKGWCMEASQYGQDCTDIVCDSSVILHVSSIFSMRSISCNCQFWQCQMLNSVGKVLILMMLLKVQGRLRIS